MSDKVGTTVRVVWLRGSEREGCRKRIGLVHTNFIDLIISEKGATEKTDRGVLYL